MNVVRFRRCFLLWVASSSTSSLPSPTSTPSLNSAAVCLSGSQSFAPSVDRRKHHTGSGHQGRSQEFMPTGGLKHTTYFYHDRDRKQQKSGSGYPLPQSFTRLFSRDWGVRTPIWTPWPATSLVVTESECQGRIYEFSGGDAHGSDLKTRRSDG